MKRKLVSSFCAGMVAISMAPQAAFASPELEAKVKQLEAQLEQLKNLVMQEKQHREDETKSLASEVSKVSDRVSASSHNVNLSKGTSLSYGGFIKVNGMFDDYQDGAAPSASVASRILVPSLIPVGDSASSEGAEFNSDVATSRLYFKTSTDTAVGKIKSHIEMDFLSGGGDERVSNSNNSRMRHAYLAWDYADDASLLVGQTWSTFFNVGALPESVEFIGPTSGTIFNRQQQIRWTKKLGGGSSFMLAAENPSTSLADAGSGIAASNFDDNSVPDVIARFNGKSGGHSFALSAMGREIAYNDGANDESDFGFAVNLAGKIVFSNGDDLKYSIAHGNLGRYIALNAFRDGGIDAAGNLDLTSVTGGYVAYRHHWNEKLRSTIQYSYSSADLANGLSSANTESVSNFNLNLFYSPTPKITFGGAIIQANRELENGTDGDLTRLQLTAKYGF
ncbi:DcaP family trimeric outer membrane transporter [Arenicella sp. 4NH20-0111]|uniref:DcaP family trimeric outer membrane transporter n=1 Tax=Arenicella sp. 4NH20-0111 TaxID=3127648 RepID=UPI003103E52C